MRHAPFRSTGAKLSTLLLLSGLRHIKSLACHGFCDLLVMVFLKSIFMVSAHTSSLCTSLKSIFMVCVHVKPFVHLFQNPFGKGDAMLASSPFSELAQAPIFTSGPTLCVFSF